MSSIFQFHKGTIRTDPRMPINEQHYHFNSIKVQNVSRWARLNAKD